jgi:molybdopterin/thiamine biosynthesis adenylyltransferase
MPEILGAPLGFQDKLNQLTVLVVGCGAVGGRAVEDLARMRPEALILVDPKRFKEESILTQPIGPDGIGCWKAEAMALRAKAISPGTEVKFFNGPIDEIDVHELVGVDVILLSTDNLSAEVETGQLALRLGCPLIHGAVHGETTVVQVRTFANRDGTGPCPACGLNQYEWAQVAAETSYACDPAGAAHGSGGAIHTVPTRCLPSVCAIAGAQMVLHLLKLVFPFGAPVADTLFEFCGHTGKVAQSSLERSATCVCDHRPWRFVASPCRHTADLTLGQTAEEAGVHLNDGSDAQFRVGRFDWIESVACVNEHRSPVGRFCCQGNPFESEPCLDCGSTLSIPPLGRRDAVLASTLGQALWTPLRHLGVAHTPWIQIETGRETALVHFQPHS